MPGFLITVSVGMGVFMLHSVAAMPSERAMALCNLIAALLMVGMLLIPATRQEAAKLAIRLGPWAALAVGAGHLMQAGGNATWAGLVRLGEDSLGPCLGAISAYSLARAADRFAVLRGLYLASGLSALWSSLSFLAASRGAAPSAAALPLDFAADPAAGSVFSMGLALCAFALADEASRTAKRSGPRLAPTGQRLILPFLMALCCLLALALIGKTLPLLAGGLGALGVIIGLGWRARRLFGLVCAALPAAAAFGLLGLSLAGGKAAPWLSPMNTMLADPSWIALLGVLIAACLLSKDRKRRPSRGLGLAFGIGSAVLTLAAFSSGTQSPSGQFVCALLFGLAASYHDAEAKPARRQKAFGASALPTTK